MMRESQPPKSAEDGTSRAPQIVAQNASELTNDAVGVSAEMQMLARVVLAGHTTKRLAKLLGCSVRAARCFLDESFSRQAIRDAAVLLLGELDRQDNEERAMARRRLREIAEGAGWRFVWHGGSHG